MPRAWDSSRHILNVCQVTAARPVQWMHSVRLSHDEGYDRAQLLVFVYLDQLQGYLCQTSGRLGTQCYCITSMSHQVTLTKVTNLQNINRISFFIGDIQTVNQLEDW